MHTDALNTLQQIRTINRIETYLRSARADLEHNPSNELLREFVRINERLIAQNLDRLAEAA